MKDNRLGGIALILGTISGIITMSLHPTGGGHAITPAQFEKLTVMLIGVHALAIAGLPVLFLGAFALTRRLNAPNRLSIIALVVYGFGLIAIMTAAALDGFVATDILRAIVAHTPESEQWHLLMQYNFRINQAFALIFVMFSCIAIVIWSISMMKNREWPAALGFYGIILGPALVIAVVSDLLNLHAHGFGLIIFSQAIWFIIAGILLWRQMETRPEIVSP